MIVQAKNQNAAYLKKDQRHMSQSFREIFTELVENEDEAFAAGGQSYLVQGPVAEHDCDVAIACLARGGGYDVYRTTPHEIIGRLDSRYALPFGEALDTDWEKAECYFIYDLLMPDVVNDLSSAEKAILVWFVKQAITGGNVVIAPCNFTADKIDLNILGETFGQFIEQEMGLINVYRDKAQKKAKHKPNG